MTAMPRSCAEHHTPNAGCDACPVDHDDRPRSAAERWHADYFAAVSLLTELASNPAAPSHIHAAWAQAALASRPGQRRPSPEPWTVDDVLRREG
jgi:hypothetical protein